MEIVIRGDNVEVTPAIKEYATEKLERIEKLLKNPDEVDISVVFKIFKNIQVVEITVPLKNFILRVEEGQEDLYAAIDTAVDKIVRQLRKHKTRLKNFGKTKKLEESFIYDLIEELEEEREEEKVVKRKVIDLKPMTEEEAILQMELIDHEFFLFIDAKTMKPAVLYKRKKGNYGILQAE